jgi:hypothetical protein
MRKSFRLNGLLILAALWLGSTLPLCATTIFNNSSNDLHVSFNPGTYEVGDQIILASTERYLIHFDFEFWGTNTLSPGNVTFAGAVEARVRFYENNGTLFNGYASPGTNFYDSGWFSGFSPTSRNTLQFSAGVGLDFPSGGLFIPVDEMTWSVQFRGMGATDSVGVDIYSPPVVGADYPDYWQNNGVTGWTLQTNTVAMNFAATMDAIPEPSVLALLLAGGLGILTLVRRQRRTN